MARRALSLHYRTSTWWTEEDLAHRPSELTAAVANALIEDPTLLLEPTRPLDELLYITVRQCEQDHHLRDAAAWAAGDTISFSISGMPESLHQELERRGRYYGMSSDQYAILALGHLAWRTPFTENLGGEFGWEPARFNEGDERPTLRPV